jgi:hypothetical protein
MSKTPCEKPYTHSDDELLSEYGFDYETAKPNRFAAAEKQALKVVILDEDVAQVFTTPEAVNKVLRALIETMPPATVAALHNNSGVAD